MLHLVAPEPCYTEEDVQYKVENMGLDNVDISEQTSAEECRANCRYFQVTILYRSQFIEFPFYRTFEAAKYFTYNTGNSKCRCKPDMDMGAVRQDKTGRISGNVECDIVMTGGCAGTAGGCGGSGKACLSNTLITSDRNQNREFWIQLISGVYLIHNGIFYLINVLKFCVCVVTINRRLM